MNSFELNKIMGAVLGTLMFVMGVGFVAEAIYQPIEDNGPGYALPEPDLVASAPVDEAPAQSIGFFLASASAERGAAATRKCQSCHSFGEGEPNKMGPNLYNTVGNTKAHAEGFAYSDILLEQKAEGQVWSYDNLNAFLENPKSYAPGTKMNFAGVRSPEERADIMAYMQTLSGAPVPFPAAEDVAPAAGGDEAAAAPADDGQSERVAQIALLMATANEGRGESAARKCQSCHSFGEGEPNKMGPNLYNTVGNTKAHAEGYAYSDILLQQKAEGQVWSYANLDAFLEDPRGYAPGTKMAFAGVRSPEERANIMAYMRSLAAEPVPLPGQ
ncbi:MAG: cytochrome c family protein [Devosia sp.]|uniref:c-type cytochrome n=1 Tax=Devosia sp. TaxID=1871048 RepID=UPI0019FF204D|nr:cytochrome c family protein [Devosia sp.]MBF0680742.1 cytochrome c family protein [Devosia sp.]